MLLLKVEVVNDDAEALEYFCYQGNFANRKSGNPVVIILDLNLPKVDGLEVLKQIKSEPKLHLIPVVILTSSNEELGTKVISSDARPSQNYKSRVRMAILASCFFNRS
jgi:CheY-like chemotaxis protein